MQDEKEVTYEELVAYASGELSGTHTERVVVWLGLVPEAARNAVLLREVIETLRNDDTEPATPSAIRRGIAAIAARRIGWLDKAQQLMAHLVADSRRQHAPVGYRGPASSYQLAFESAIGRVDIQILPTSQPGGPGFRLRGQVTADAGCAVGEVVLRRRGEGAASASTADEFGRFKLQVDPGTYDLWIEVDHGSRAIVAPDLEIGPES